LTALDGNFDDCSGSCAMITGNASGTTVFAASITKSCSDEILVFARGIGADGFACGNLGIRFSGADASLPAELVAFKAEQEERANQLFWQTASEENVLAFEIQKSLDGTKDFETIGAIEAAGNSTTLQTYDFIDKDPLSLAYYRLKVIDNDFSFEYSEVLAVERTKTEIDILEVFPVPVVNNEVTVMIHSTKEGPVFIDLFDMTGKIIMQDRIEVQIGVNRIPVKWESNEGNFYFFTLYNGKERISKKILKVNLD